VRAVISVQSRPGVVVAGSALQKPLSGGHLWVLLQYLVGLRRLGFDALLLDLSDREARSTAPIAATLERFGIDFAVLDDSLARDVERERILRRTRRSAFLLNVMGFLNDPEILAAAPKRVFLDIDPGFGQMWRELGLADVFAAHDAYVTIAENIGRPDCAVPTSGLEWLTTRQPVVLDEWPAPPKKRDVFTTVASWRGAYDAVEYNGKRYGLRCHEFRKFFALPRQTAQEFELALDIHPADNKDREALEQNGWRLVHPHVVAGDPWSYRSYIQDSMAEFCVAKGMYVETKGGWFSDRSICYLASGKPVLHQDTGLRHLYPTEEGLILFSTLGEAASGVEELRLGYERHSRAAREIAEEYFDSDKVLTRLLEKLDVG
jgi:hypothetical protein